MPRKTPQLLLATAVASGLLFSAAPAQATELSDVQTGPAALVNNSPSDHQPNQAPTPAEYFADRKAPESALSLSELAPLGLPSALTQLDRYHGQLTDSAAQGKSLPGESFTYWEDDTEEEEALFEQIDQLLPPDSEYWDEQQWLEFFETEDGQKMLELIEELNELMLSQLPEESRQLIEAMEALLPEDADFWNEEQWEEFYQTDEGQEFLELLEQFYEGFWEEDPDSGFTEEEELFWESIDAMFPEGVEDWDDEQWEAFYETEEGQEILDLINEFYGIEVDEEEEAFWDTLEQMLPEGSDDWDDEAWDEYYATDAGKELLAFILTYELDHAEDEWEVELLVEYYREVLANHSQWLETFLKDYFEGSAEPTDSAEPTEAPMPTPNTPQPTPSAPEANEPDTPQGSASPTQITPLGQPEPSADTTPDQSGDPQPTQESAQPLAATGPQGLLFAGLGLALLAVGSLVLGLRRKATHKA